MWLDEALAGEEEASKLEGDAKADVCIVGGGYSGLWSAIRLKELDPSLDVVLVEGDVCGGGPSGRNGGFVLSWWAKYGKLEHLVGREEALRLGQAAAEAVGAIGAFCAANEIDAHFRPDGWLWAATSDAQLGAWDSTLEMLEQRGVAPFARLDPGDASQRAGSATHFSGVFEASAATVQPALLARGLRRVALERGVRIFERTPLVRLERSRPPRVHTPHGVVTSERVVLAMNAWLAQVGELSSSLFVLASDIVATEPIPERLEAIGFSSGIAVSDSRLLVNYYRTTLDGRVAFGQGGGLVAVGGHIGREMLDGPRPARRAEVESSFRALYPMLADVTTPHAWTGPIDRSRTGLPFFGRLGGRPDIVYGAGYSGNGVGPCYLGGHMLASLALRLDDEWAHSAELLRPRGGFPPEPIKHVGARVVRAAVARKERAEDRGKRPDRITTRVAALAPAGLVPVKQKSP
jgi:putative aminophosphonate oxidoreductase